MSSQGLDYDASDLLTKEIVPTEVEATEVEHSAQVTTITVDSITNPAIIIDREYFYTSLQKNNNKRKAEIGPEWQVLKNKVFFYYREPTELDVHIECTENEIEDSSK